MRSFRDLTFLGTLLVFGFVHFIASAQSSTKRPLKIKITRTYAEECPRYAGMPNQRFLRIRSDKITVKDPDTLKPVTDINLPGRYLLEFADMEVTDRDLEYLVGDITVVLSVPIQGTEVRINASPLGPEQGRVNLCDRDSFLVAVGNEPACRYCNLCEQTRKLESKLTARQDIVGLLDSEKFSNNCEKFRAGEYYTLRRTIVLPDPNTADSRLNSDIDFTQELQKAFKIGTGRIVTNLRLLSKPRSTSQTDYCHSRCRSNLNPFDCSRCKIEYNSKLGRGQLTTTGLASNCEVDDPLTSLAACYRIEFSYNAEQDPALTQKSPAGPPSNDLLHACDEEFRAGYSYCESCYWCTDPPCKKKCRCLGRSNVKECQ